jgi:hypothetical protein
MISNVQLAPWKVSFNPEGNGPYAVKVKLSDMLFTKPSEDPSTWTPRTTGGIPLPHDIIVYDPTIFNSDGTLNYHNAQDDRQKKGIFLSKVKYDSRAVYTSVTNANYSSGGYRVYSLDAAVALTEEDFSTVGQTYNLILPDAFNGLAEGDFYAGSCTTTTSGSAIESTSFVILSGRDTALEATIPGSTIVPYTRMRFNPGSGLAETIEIVRFLTDFVGGTSFDVMSPTTNPFLQIVELWVRCAYFADYVIPDNFEQDLYGTAQVIHKNIILGSGDFIRFTRENSSTDLRPYLPTTPPREESLGIAAGDAGTFPIPPVTGEWDSPTADKAAPIGWYDPDKDGGSIPSGYLAIPMIGNIYTSGRIFSPTIDELWTYVKKIISGRDVDVANTDPGPRSSSASKTNVDTRIISEPAITLGSKIGDPLNRSGSSFINAPEGILYEVSNAVIVAIDSALETGDVIANYTPANTALLQTTGDWAPRTKPYSLRELEAFIMYVLLNFETFMNFLAKYGAMTGAGWNNGSETNVQGSLYQLHVDYDISNRTLTKWSSYSSTQLPTDSASTYGDELPDTAGAYDRLTNIPQQDVVMSAEGKWRYMFDHVRVPVLDETY